MAIHFWHVGHSQHCFTFFSLPATWRPVSATVWSLPSSFRYHAIEFESLYVFILWTHINDDDGDGRCHYKLQPCDPNTHRIFAFVVFSVAIIVYLYNERLLHHFKWRFQCTENPIVQDTHIHKCLHIIRMLLLRTYLLLLLLLLVWHEIVSLISWPLWTFRRRDTRSAYRVRDG